MRDFRKYAESNCLLLESIPMLLYFDIATSCCKFKMIDGTSHLCNVTKLKLNTVTVKMFQTKLFEHPWYPYVLKSS